MGRRGPSLGRAVAGWSMLLAGVLTLSVVALSVLAAPAAADPIFPEAGSPVQDELWGLFNLVGWMAIIISVVVSALIGYAAVKFRGDPHVKKKGRWFTHNNRLEITWTVVTALVLVFLGVVTAQAMDRIETPPAEDVAGEQHLDVIVVGSQWIWEFIYPDGSTSQDELWVPAGWTVSMKIIACDVIHSLYIPELGVKIDTRTVGQETCEAVKDAGAVPEGVKANAFWFKADRAGSYRLQCAEYCGTGHAFMEGQVVAFDLAERRAQDPSLPPFGPPPAPVERTVVNVEATDSGFTPSSFNVTSGDNVRLVLWNNGTSDHSLVVEAPIDVSTGPVQPGSSAQVDFVAAGNGTIAFFSDVGDDRAQGLEGSLGITAGTLVEVVLSDFVIEMSTTELEPGKAYSFHVTNAGPSVHNLYIGLFTDNRDARIGEFQTDEVIRPGESTWLNVTMPDQDVTFDVWCNLPQHAELGMLDEVQIGAGGAPGEEPMEQRLLLPGLEVAGALAGLAVAAFLLNRVGGGRRD